MHAHIKLIIGLGNPGESYEKTRHNAGAWFVEHLSKQERSQFRMEPKFTGKLCTIRMGEHEYKLFLPQTFMNVCGSPIKRIAHYFQILPEEILIAHDDLDLPPGIARLKKGGGDGGHNGLKDIIEKFQTRDFYRLRLGIGHPGKGADVAAFVLDRVSRADQALIHAAIADALQALPLLLEGHVQKAMHQLHTRPTDTDLEI